MLRRPIVRVMGPSGRDLVGVWGASLMGLTITDAAGYESDECVIRMRAEPPGWSFPARGTQYQVHVGWSADGMALTGTYTVQRIRAGGDPEEGTHLEIVCRAADMIDRLKAVDSGHWDDKTAGEIFRDIAGKAGLQAVVAGAIDGIRIPYRVRWQQSAIDFATRLGDDIGAMVKTAAGRLVVTQRGSGESAGGSALPAVEIRYDPNYRFEADLEPRPEYHELDAGWFDPAEGIRKVEKAEPGYSASRHGLPHVYPSRDEAKRAAEASGQEHGRQSGTATFELPGDARAVAEAPVVCSGFGSDIDGTEWVCSSVTHEVQPDRGWTTTVECETKGGGSKGKS